MNINMILMKRLGFVLFIFPNNWTPCFDNSLTVITSLGTITVVTPYFGFALLPLIYIYVKVLNYFREVSRETKRLESISRSPVYAHFSETYSDIYFPNVFLVTVFSHFLHLIFFKKKNWMGEPKFEYSRYKRSDFR